MYTAALVLPICVRQQDQPELKSNNNWRISNASRQRTLKSQANENQADDDRFTDACLNLGIIIDGTRQGKPDWAWSVFNRPASTLSCLCRVGMHAGRVPVQSTTEMRCSYLQSSVLIKLQIDKLYTR
ncbi:Cysteine--tRNA ligase [Trichinella pseudospiralis]